MTGSFTKGSTLFVLEKQDSWIRVAANDGRTGWVAERFTQTRTASRTNKVIERSPRTMKTERPIAPSGQPPAAKPSTSAAGKTDIATRLKKLKQLHDQGLITKQEFDAKRTEILESL